MPGGSRARARGGAGRLDINIYFPPFLFFFFSLSSRVLSPGFGRAPRPPRPAPRALAGQYSRPSPGAGALDASPGSTCRRNLGAGHHDVCAHRDDEMSSCGWPLTRVLYCTISIERQTTHRSECPGNAERRHAIDTSSADCCRLRCVLGLFSQTACVCTKECMTTKGGTCPAGARRTLHPARRLPPRGTPRVYGT